jgi:hypothetical protein
MICRERVMSPGVGNGRNKRSPTTVATVARGRGLPLVNGRCGCSVVRAVPRLVMVSATQSAGGAAYAKCAPGDQIVAPRPCKCGPADLENGQLAARR